MAIKIDIERIDGAAYLVSANGRKYLIYAHNEGLKAVLLSSRYHIYGKKTSDILEAIKEIESRDKPDSFQEMLIAAIERTLIADDTCFYNHKDESYSGQMFTIFDKETGQVKAHIDTFDQLCERFGMSEAKIRNKIRNNRGLTVINGEVLKKNYDARSKNGQHLRKEEYA